MKTTSSIARKDYSANESFRGRSHKNVSVRRKFTHLSNGEAIIAYQWGLKASTPHHSKTFPRVCIADVLFAQDQG
jgi:hypothetical protein